MAKAKTRPRIDLPLALKPLAAEARWVLWRWTTTANGGLTKVPYKGSAPNYKADTTSPRTWCDFKVAMRAYTKGLADGVGYVLTDGAVAAVDIDDCRNAESGELHPWAQEQIDAARSYAEITPSAAGVRIIGLAASGTVPLNNPYRVPDTEVSGELYRRPGGRFITISGAEIGTATELTNIDARLDALTPLLVTEVADGARPAGKKHRRFGDINERALANLDKWVRQIFPTAKKTRRGGYRVSSADLGRGLEEDLSIDPRGIKYFGVCDQGDPRQGRRTPVALVAEWRHVEQPQAAEWLEQVLEQRDGEPPPPPPEPESEPEASAADVEITRLAELAPGDYDQARKAASEKLGMRLSTLDTLVARERERLGLSEEAKKTADILIELATARVKLLFHTLDMTGYATVPLDDHLENWPVRGRGFKRWLAREFFNETKKAANSDAIQAALNVIEARAHFDGPERPVFVRVGSDNGKLYLDLTDRRWRAIEIDAAGWRIVDHAPVAFRRAAGMQTLPDPVAGGSIKELRPFLNIAEDNESDFVLAGCFLLAALRDRGPYPVLALAGEHGSAKSTLTAVLRRLIDPNSAPLRALPREDRDLFIAAVNAHLLAFDNVSTLPPWISDTLCRLATGGGFATRQLFSDGDEVLFDAMRPIILNGIEDIVSRPDLADRSIFLNLQNIADSERKSELEFWADFDRAHARILGVLLDGVSHGLRMLPVTKLEGAPRMADFSLWSTACETAFWQAGTFKKAYSKNRDDAVTTVIEADLVASAVEALVNKIESLNKPREQKSTEGQPVPRWGGTASELLGALVLVIPENQPKLKEWPATPRALSARLRRAAPTLRRVGIEITFGKRESGGRSEGKRSRHIAIEVREGNFASPPSPTASTNENNDLEGDGKGDANQPADFASPDRPPSNPLKENDKDCGDGGDAKFPPLTGLAKGNDADEAMMMADAEKGLDPPPRSRGRWQ
jgi:hypothetical protein